MHQFKKSINFSHSMLPPPGWILSHVKQFRIIKACIFSILYG
ncbi:MAG: hypothetical protein GY874_03525 [Desulfobacteraceae bacterium]|nr:hypothetical protein [Desulfobacteraceae bacterium]